MNLLVERLPGKFWERECRRSFYFVVSPSPFPVYRHHAFCDFGWVWWMSIHVQVIHIKGLELGRHGRWFWLGARVVVMWGRGEEGLGIIGLCFVLWFRVFVSSSLSRKQLPTLSYLSLLFPSTPLADIPTPPYLPTYLITCLGVLSLSQPLLSHLLLPPSSRP